MTVTTIARPTTREQMPPIDQGRRDNFRGVTVSETANGPILPFELWRLIFLEVFSDLDLPRRMTMNIAREREEPYLVMTDLHAKYLVFRLLWVNKHWYLNARDVFYEDLSAETSHGLQGIRAALTKDRQIGQAIRRIILSFPLFRATETEPRKPLPYEVPEGIEKESDAHRKISAEMANRSYGIRRWAPSSTRQREHWLRWQGFARDVLTLCPSLRDVQVTFTSDFSVQTARRSSRDYRTLFGKPDLTIEGVLAGLRSIPNLRNLALIDPSPLEEYGPALQSWTKLKAVSIRFSSQFPEIVKLPETSFHPPRDLERLQLHDWTNGAHHWPLSSDLGSCRNLKILDLGIADSRTSQDIDVNTLIAISFLLSTYQHTLTELSLRRLGTRGSRFTDMDTFPSSFQPTFRPIFETANDTGRRFNFSTLQKLTLESTEDDTIFRMFDAPHLEELDVNNLLALTPLADTLPIPPPPEDTEWKAYWIKVLKAPSLARVKRLQCSYVGNRLSRTPLPFARACAELGMEYIDRHGKAVAEPHQANEMNEDEEEN